MLAALLLFLLYCLPSSIERALGSGDASHTLVFDVFSLFKVRLVFTLERWMSLRILNSYVVYFATLALILLRKMLFDFLSSLPIVTSSFWLCGLNILKFDVLAFFTCALMYAWAFSAGSWISYWTSAFVSCSSETLSDFLIVGLSWTLSGFSLYFPILRSFLILSSLASCSFSALSSFLCLDRGLNSSSGMKS